MNWRRAGRRDLERLLAFLIPQEWRAVSYTSRLRRNGRGVFPSPLEASVLIYGEGTDIHGTMMLTSRGVLLPACSPNLDYPGALPPGPFPGWKDLGARLYSMMGPAGEVSWLAGQLPLPALVNVDYHLMVQTRRSFSDLPGGSFDRPPGISVRPACPRDLEALMPLQIRYELEEVVIDKTRFREQGCRLNLKEALRSQLVLMAERNGKVVAKAGTNARGFKADQIGGVFTAEEARNSGVACRLMEELLLRIFAEKSVACLFVKKTNQPALSLYRKLGFRIADGYRISYFKA